MERRTLRHAHENPLKCELIPALKKSVDTRDIVERNGEAVSVVVPYATNAAHRGAIFSPPSTRATNRSRSSMTWPYSAFSNATKSAFSSSVNPMWNRVS
jgi:hypothetical protein